MRRRRIMSHSSRERPSTKIAPALCVCRPLISFRVVVLPEPLRPRSTRVSPRWTSRFRLRRRVVPLSRRYSTLRNSMAGPGLGESFICAFRREPGSHCCEGKMPHDSRRPPRTQSKGRRCEKPRLQLLVRFFWQACDANTGVAFVPDIEADQEGGDLLQNAGVLQLTAIDGTHAGNF